MSYGLSLAVTTLVGNAVGSGNIKLAKKIAWIVMIISLVLSLTTVVVLCTLKKQIARVYTSDESVFEILVETLPYLAVHLIFDMSQCVMYGIIRGLGLQFRAFLVALVCYYLVGVPLAAYLTLGEPG